MLSNKIYILISNLLDDASEAVLIFDDSPYDRSRSKKVELLARFFEHNTNTYIKGFRMLTLGWSNRNSFLGLDFALLSTNTSLAEPEIIRFYGKRWDIEVFFKMCKQHLKLVKEIEFRDFDGLIGHTSMVLARYNILTWFQRQRVDQRSFGDLFGYCNQEMENIKFVDALKSILDLAMAAIVNVKGMSERLMQSMLDAIMGAAIILFGLSENKSNLITAS